MPARIRKSRLNFTVPLFSFVGFRIYVGSLVGNGGGERDTSQAITRKYPVVGITATQAEIRVFDFINLKILAEFVVRIMGEHGRQGIIIEIQFVPGIAKPTFHDPQLLRCTVLCANAAG